MIEIRRIDEAHKRDINIRNAPFKLFGRMLPEYTGGRWQYGVEVFPESDVREMCFPDEDYDYDAMKDDSAFLGAYDGDKCVGLAILQQGFFKYMYLYDLKVSAGFRGRGVASLLMGEAKRVCLQAGYMGLYTQGQDNNLAACRFYIKNGFVIGGLDTNVYKGTPQEGKSDIIFYLDC